MVSVIEVEHRRLTHIAWPFWVGTERRFVPERNRGGLLFKVNEPGALGPGIQRKYLWHGAPAERVSIHPGE